MCLIAYQPPGHAPFPDAVLHEGWVNNPHGAGYMFAVDGVLHVRKPFYKLKDLRDAYLADHAAHGAASCFVLHFRWSTHGDKGETNVHPHTLANGNVALVHNGVLHDFTPPPGAKISDTVFFCRTVLYGREAVQLMSEDFCTWLGGLIGADKFVLMDAAGNVRIVNESGGLWDGQCWYSNTTYEPWEDKTTSLVGTGGTIARGYSWPERSKSEDDEVWAKIRQRYSNAEQSESLFGRADEWEDGKRDPETPREECPEGCSVAERVHYLETVNDRNGLSGDEWQELEALYEWQDENESDGLDELWEAHTQEGLDQQWDASMRRNA